MPAAAKSQLLIFRAVDGYLGGRLPFEAMQERIRIAFRSPCGGNFAKGIFRGLIRPTT